MTSFRGRQLLSTLYPQPSRIDMIVRHMWRASRSRKEYTCHERQYGTGFSSGTNLRRHVGEVHLSRRSHTCPNEGCEHSVKGRGFNWSEQLRANLKSMHSKLCTLKYVRASASELFLLAATAGIVV